MAKVSAMTGTNSTSLDDLLKPNRRHLRLQTLVRLRWLAVAGQTASVLVVYFGLGFKLPIAPALVVIGLSVILNVFLRLRFTASVRLIPVHAALLLAYDILQLVCLLYLTGGLENPFALLLLVPVMVSASTLPLRLTLVLASLVVLSASGLAIAHLPLPWYPGAPLKLPFLFVAGVYIALIACLAFMGFHVWRISEETRQMSDAVAATELFLAREQHLSALDGLAAAAAHELGTPLGTISIVTKELMRATGPDDPAAEDIRLLKSQVDRCRDILTKLTSLRDADRVPNLQTLTKLDDLLVWEPGSAKAVLHGGDPVPREQGVYSHLPKSSLPEEEAQSGVTLDNLFNPNEDPAQWDYNALVTAIERRLRETWRATRSAKPTSASSRRAR